MLVMSGLNFTNHNGTNSPEHPCTVRTKLTRGLLGNPDPTNMRTTVDG